MNELSKKEGVYEFGEFRLDPHEKRLWRAGELVAVPPKAFELLAFLVRNQDHLVGKEEILRAVWADSFVEDGNLSLNIHALRKLLGEDHKFIETVPRRGYRFTGEVRELRIENVSVEQNIANITVTQTAAPTVGDGTSVINQQTLVLTDEAAAQVAENLHRQIRRQNLLYLGAVVVVLLALGGLAVVLLRTAPKTDEPLRAANAPASAANVRTIAVLPFKNLTSDKETDGLALGLTDSLITRLGTLKRLAVRPTSAVLPFAGGASPRDAGARLRVENVLEGTIQRAGKRLKVTVQLVKIPENNIIWAKSIDEADADLLKIQDSIAVEITRAMIADLTQEEQNMLARAQTKNEDAFEMYLQGRYFWNKRTAADLRRSIEFFDGARTLDPGYALAYAGLADAYQLIAEYVKFAPGEKLTPAEAYAKSREASRRALELDENSAEAHTSLAYTLAFYDWNWADAEREFRRAVEINPNYATARLWLGEWLVAGGRFDEAFFEFRRAEELDPTSPVVQTDLAGYYYLTRQFDKGLEQTGRMIESDPKFAYAYAYRWLCFEQKGMPNEAAEALIAGDGISLPADYLREERANFKTGGWTALWKFKAEKNEVPPYSLVFNNYIKALTVFRTGDPEKTFEYLAASGAARERWFVNLKSDPQWDPIRGDPRFADLVRQANLAP